MAALLDILAADVGGHFEEVRGRTRDTQRPPQSAMVRAPRVWSVLTDTFRWTAGHHERVTVTPRSHN
jgi:hypothetical protein